MADKKKKMARRGREVPKKPFDAAGNELEWAQVMPGKRMVLRRKDTWEHVAAGEVVWR